MRHQDRGRSLSRSPAHRKALLCNLAQELFQHKRIHTTLTKAKELRPFAERLVTHAKKADLAARRRVAMYLTRKAVIKSLFDEIALTFADRNGGYTRIIKLGNRHGDNAPTAIIELVGFEGVLAAKSTASESDAAKGAKKTAAKAKTGKARQGAGDAKAAKAVKGAKGGAAHTRRATKAPAKSGKAGGRGE
ncbi:50S ribosomal protein L17 [candidate division KSB1 bacterium]|nr:50S ribosomal protein L17 [candidate division KSB1 bacterium]